MIARATVNGLTPNLMWKLRDRNASALQWLIVAAALSAMANSAEPSERGSFGRMHNGDVEALACIIASHPAVEIPDSWTYHKDQMWLAFSKASMEDREVALKRTMEILGQGGITFMEDNEDSALEAWARHRPRDGVVN